MHELEIYKNTNATARPMEPDADVKHLAMLQAIAPFAKSKVQKNMTTIDVDYAHRNTKLMLILMPEWAEMFPPFNLARLSAVAKKAGYKTKCLDLNIAAYRTMRDPVKSGAIAYDPWDGTREWTWREATYYTDIHPHLETLYRNYIEEIKKFNPTVIGFTMYYCNEQPVLWLAAELKKAIPGIKLVVGGSNIHNNSGNFKDNVFDYVVSGEGEMMILEILEEIEQHKTYDTVQIRRQPEEQRLNLNELPLPDYTDFNFNEYMMPNGVCSELSRGCTAKCTFCDETHFWKYRQRMATDILKEVESLYYSRGTDVFWFIDSLVNGNLNELRAFCKGVIAKEMKIHWTGYCRCDGRMDLEYYQDLADSGCTMLNYGIESGSQKVLDDMDKGVTIAEMEQNLANGKKTGVQAFTNWIVGFPTEDYQGFADTITFLWRNRNQGIVNIAAGFGYGLGMNSIIGQNPEKFNLLDHKYLNGWITRDFKLSKFNVLMRMKSFAIFLQQLITENHVNIPHRENLPLRHYKITFNNPLLQKEIEYEQFDYNIIKPNINPLADSIVNEMFVLFRMLWRMRGSFIASVVFDEKLDTEEWGGMLTGPFSSSHLFSIDDAGNWDADFSFDFKQPPALVYPADPMTPRSPFFAQDYSHELSTTTIRAKKLARPKWGDGSRSHEEFMDLMVEERMLNSTIDFSFTYNWVGCGCWGNNTDYLISVPNKHTNKVAQQTEDIHYINFK
jgi:radical SAM superfamily enzyme YgiQ (UPF0313 family)